jgi:hypothetical protein
MPKGAIIALLSATILGLLSLQAEIVTAIIGWIWAGLHVIAAVSLWNRK